jgi:hypothetical protein
MKKIGTTASGTVIVEMSAEQFEALSKLKGTPPPPPTAATMSVAEKVEYARPRIAKLNPKKKEAVARSITAMFQFTGGIPDAQVDEIIARLQKEKFFVIDEAGRVTYTKER